MAGGKHLSLEDRLLLKELLDAGKTKKEVASYLRVSLTTIYNEFTRGRQLQKIKGRGNKNQYQEIYNPYKAQSIYENRKTRKGVSKLRENSRLMNFIEDRVVRCRDSICESLHKAVEQGLEVNVSRNTVYAAIRKGYFTHLELSHLAYRQKKRKRKKKVQIRRSVGKSIEERPAEVLDREVFGHWEMDTVVSSRNKGACLLVLVERKTRKMLLFRLKNKSAKNVVAVINRLERQLGLAMFRRIFKSITVDNGTEFFYVDRLEASRRSKTKRTDMYYCHAYCSWERGTGETSHRFIRRWFPKNTLFEDVEKKLIKEVETWINNYHRAILGYRTSEELYLEEINTIKENIRLKAG